MKLERVRIILAVLLMSAAADLVSAGPVGSTGLLMPRHVVEPGTSRATTPTAWTNAGAQTGTGQGDPLWNGILIGAGAGALYGMVIAPPQFCGHNDPECAAIVRVVIGLPSIGAGAGIGALVDYFIGRQHPASAATTHRLRLIPIAGRGVRGVQARVRF